MRLVVALGGNALSPAAGTGSVEELRGALRDTGEVLADLVVGGISLVLTHGNGPQVGRILLQQELAADEVMPMPMDVCGAQSQGQLGYLLSQALDNALRARSVSARVLCLVTQVVVDGRDAAFRRPGKAMGPSYSGAQARQIAHRSGHVFALQPDGGWRRVVASPRPLRIVEEGPLRDLADAGHVVVAAGGGGVPVVEHDGRLRGVEAVVDKDRSAALLALAVGAQQLLLLTDVAGVQVGFGTAQARALARLTVAQARQLLANGEFGSGSMGPKVEAGCDFAERSGGRTVIAALADAAAAAQGRVGTAIVP